MKRLLLLLLLCASAHAQSVGGESLRAAIQRHLGRPYVWGATGLKSFDCSGFVWRVAMESGLEVKRTTARKMWFSTARVRAGERGAFGNLIFFDDLRHVGIVNDAATFYHAQSSKGTNLSPLNAYWKPLVAGEHQFFPVAAK